MTPEAVTTALVHCSTLKIMDIEILQMDTNGEKSFDLKKMLTCKIIDLEYIRCESAQFPHFFGSETQLFVCAVTATTNGASVSPVVRRWT